MALAEPLPEHWVPSDTFAARLALIRQRLGGWNVKRVADFCGIDDQSWRNWEAGKGKPRDYEDACRKIADATGCDRRWLMAGGPLISTCSSQRPWLSVVPGVEGQGHLLDETDQPYDFHTRPVLAGV